MWGRPRHRQVRTGETAKGRTGVWLVPCMSLIVVFIMAALPLGTAAETPPWPAAEAVRIAEPADMPTDIDVAPDGAVWYVEIGGNVSRVDPTTGESESVYQVENVVTGGERGLVGFALAHDFDTSGTFYLYYSERTEDPDGGMNRLVRVDDGKETILASLPAAVEHNGGRILVEPNGTLFVGTGENSDHEPAQDLDSLLGKILRMTPDGDPVDGNLKGLVYSYGHRNVYGLAQDPETGEVWATENMGWRRDEINRIEVGGNYGYPECEGHGRHGIDDPCPTDKGYVFPIKTFYEDRAAAPAGAAFFRGDLYWASFNEGSIHRLWQDNETQEWNDEIVFEHGPWLLDIHVTPDDTLVFASIDGIWRISFPGEDTEGVIPEFPGNTPDDGEETPAEPTGTLPAPGVAMALALVAGLLVWGRRRS